MHFVGMTWPHTCPPFQKDKPMDKIKFCKRVAVWVAVIAAALMAVIGLCFGKVIESSLFAEISKWIMMTVVVIAILECFVYFLAPLVWHFTYGKKE